MNSKEKSEITPMLLGIKRLFECMCAVQNAVGGSDRRQAYLKNERLRAQGVINHSSKPTP